jgi:hypothetical protein
MRLVALDLDSLLGRVPESPRVLTIQDVRADGIIMIYNTSRPRATVPPLQCNIARLTAHRRE